MAPSKKPMDKIIPVPVKPIAEEDVVPVKSIAKKGGVLAALGASPSLLGYLSAYVLWQRMVLKKASRAAEGWGPKSLAVAVSSIPYAFGNWWLKWSMNADELVKEGKLDPNRQYMLVWHPHGVFCMNSLLFFSHKSARQQVLGKPLFCGVADVLFQIPGLSEFLLLCNAKNIATSTTEKLLAKGHNVGVNPGGIHEQVETDHRKEVASFPGNFGFVRLAIKHGVPLLPCYHFGENQLFHTSEAMRNVNRFMYRKFGLAPLFLHGRFGIPQTPLLPSPLTLPKPGQNLDAKMGEPVEVGPPDDNPSDEKVQEVFQRYVASLQKLFDEYKDQCLPAEVAARGLKIDVRPIPVRRSKL